jgi:L-fucose isomerase-like protein
MEMLPFKVARFDIEYNCILGRPFLLKFMAVIHTAYTMIKMPVSKGVINLKSDQHDALACENATLTHVEKFGEKEAQDLAAKMSKTHGGSTPARTTMPRLAAGSTP